MCKLTEHIERKNLEYISQLKKVNKLAINKDEYPITCDSCFKSICSNETYLSQTLIDKKYGNTEFAYCKECMREMLSSEDIETLQLYRTELSDSPSILCDQCIKFLNDGHYDNSDEMKPLYEMLNKLKSLLKDK